MITTKLIDGTGKLNFAKVDEEGAIHTIEHAHPPLVEDNDVLPYRMRFNNNGDSDMRVDGSTTSVDFCVDASQDFDIFIKTIFVEIGDGGSPALNKFGALSALTNGVAWLYFGQVGGEYELHEGIKTNKEFIRIGIDTHGIGTGVDAYLADVSGGGSEKSYLPIIDLGEMYGLRYGVRLRKNSTDRLIFRVQDDLTALSTFDAIAYGLRI